MKIGDIGKKLMGVVKAVVDRVRGRIPDSKEPNFRYYVPIKERDALSNRLRSKDRRHKTMACCHRNATARRRVKREMEKRSRHINWGLT